MRKVVLVDDPTAHPVRELDFSSLPSVEAAELLQDLKDLDIRTIAELMGAMDRVDGYFVRLSEPARHLRISPKESRTLYTAVMTSPFVPSAFKEGWETAPSDQEIPSDEETPDGTGTTAVTAVAAPKGFKQQLDDLAVALHILKPRNG